MKSHLYSYQTLLGLVLLMLVLSAWKPTKGASKEQLSIISTVNSITTTMTTQNIPTKEEVHHFFNNQNMLITYREGEVIYGTYYFLEIHYCPSGQYGLYGSSVKKTVLGNEQRNSWQEYGNWQVMEREGLVGLYYTTTAGAENFVPIYRLANGDFYIKESISIVKQGAAVCN